MALTARTPPPPPTESPGVTTAAIVGMVAKGLSVRQIVDLFPELTAGEVRAAMLRAANLVADEDASLRDDDAVGRIIADAQASAGLNEDEATDLAVAETRKARVERTDRKK